MEPGHEAGCLGLVDDEAQADVRRLTDEIDRGSFTIGFVLVVSGEIPSAMSAQDNALQQGAAFPDRTADLLRVEMNRYDSVEARTKLQDFCRLLLVYLGLVVAGACVLGFKNLSTLAFGSGWYSEPPYGELLRGIIVSVNIHHFFIDGAMWKLRNPEVRRELFRHIRS